MQNRTQNLFVFITLQFFHAHIIYDIIAISILVKIKNKVNYLVSFRFPGQPTTFSSISKLPSPSYTTQFPATMMQSSAQSPPLAPSPIIQSTYTMPPVPPPLPPTMKQSTSTLSEALPQPPPPPMLSEKKIGPKTQMMKVNWNMILPHKLTKNCVWTQQQQSNLPSKDLFDGLAKNFSLKPAKNIKKGFFTKSNISLRVIDTHTAQNLLILLNVQHKHTTHEQVKQYILRCDISMLNEDFIDQLIKCLPQPHQIKQLQKLKHDGIDLADAEKFLANICDIERLIPRLRCMKFKIFFQHMSEKLERDIKAGIAACEELISCQKFNKILNLILSIGNFMNSNSINGQSIGFELPILTKLKEIKSSDKKQTLLHFIVENVESKFPDLLSFGDELLHVQEASRINVQHIKKTIQNMVTSSEIVEDELKNHELRRSADDKFQEVMSPFALKSTGQLKILQQMMNEMQNNYLKVGEYFAFDVSKYCMEECFFDVSTFKVLFAHTYGEIAKTHEMKKTMLTNNQPGRQQQQNENGGK